MWLALLEEAGVADLRVHDLRHTFASYSLSGGQTLGTVGQLLGHRSTQTTSRYAHLVDDAARAAVERVSGDLGV
jgi:integrase